MTFIAVSRVTDRTQGEQLYMCTLKKDLWMKDILPSFWFAAVCWGVALILVIGIFGKHHVLHL